MKSAQGRAPAGTGGTRGERNTDKSTTPPPSFHQLTAAAHRPVTKLLDRLDRLSDRGNGQWWASCPTAAHEHGDRSRGLSIKETPDGTVLMRCFAGCDVGSIVQAVGLELSDLFPRTEHTARRPRDQHRLSARDAIEIIRQDTMVVACAGQSLLDGTATCADIDRVGEAVRRIHRVIGGVYGI